MWQICSKYSKYLKKIQHFKGRRVFEEQRRCTSGKPDHFRSGKPKHLWLHKENEGKLRQWLVPLASGLKQPKRKAERVGYNPQTPFIWESRLPGTKPGNGPSLPRATHCQPRCSHALSLPLAPGLSRKEDQFSFHPTISTPLTAQKTIQEGIQRICWNFNEEIWVSEHM